jgi:hypothetical protein
MTRRGANDNRHVILLALVVAGTTAFPARSAAAEPVHLVCTATVHAPNAHLDRVFTFTHTVTFSGRS